MKIELPKTCPVCGAETYITGASEAYYSCHTEISYVIYPNDHGFDLDLSVTGNHADSVLIKFGTSEVSGYEEENHNDINAN